LELEEGDEDEVGPPVELRRGRSSMAMQEGKFLHGLVGEREVWGQWEGGRESRGCSGD